MANDLQIKITAVDGASRVLTGIGSSAKAAGSDIATMGTQGEQGFRRVGESAQKAGADIKAMSSEIHTVGAAMVGIGAAMTAAIAIPMTAGTKAALSQVNAVQQATVALRAYEKDASKVDDVLSSLVKYARSDMGVLFQREDLFAAAQGLKVMGDNTEDLVKHVEIMSRSVGVGAGTWNELSQVIGRVGSTGKLTGIEFDNLTKMGFQLDDSLRNTTVTWEELFTALDKGIPVDAMADQVNTLRGMITRFQSSVRDLGVAFLGIDKDTSQFIEGGLGDRLSEGLGQATDLMKAMAPAAATFGDAAAFAAGQANTLATAFLALPQPIQTAITMATGLGGAMTLATGTLILALPKLVAFRDALAALSAGRSISGMLATAGRFTAIGAAATLAGVAIVGMVQHTRDMVAASEDLDRVWRDLRLSGLNEEATQLKDVRSEINGLIDDMEGASIPLIGNLGTSVPSDIKKAISDNLKQAVTDSRIDYEEFFGWITSEIARIGNDPDAKIEFLKDLADPDVLIQFSEATDTLTDSNDKLAKSMNNTNAATDAFDAALNGNTDAVDRLDERFAALAARQKEWIASAMEVSGLSDPLSQWNLSGHASDAAALANSIVDTASSLDTVYRVIVGNTNAIGSQVDGIEKWALELINVRGEYGKIDDLLIAGTITLGQYNAAQEAQEQIGTANAAIQQDILTIQAQQAPLIAEHTQALADQMGVISEMPAQQQLVALGWMDATTAGQAMEFQTLAVAAAAGELGVNGEQAFTSMVTGAAQANPLLKGLLIDMGLISEGADGTITVNLDGAEQAQSDIDRLNTTMGDFIDFLDDGKLNGSYSIKVNADTESAKNDIDNLGKDPPPVKVMVQPEGVSDEDWQTIVPEGGIKVDVRPEGVDLQEWSTFESLIPPITVPVTLSYNDPRQRFDEGGGVGMPDMKVRVEADVSPAEASIATLQTTAIPDKSLTITSDASDAFSAISLIDMATIQDKTLTILGDSSAADTALTSIGNATIADKTLTIWGDNTAAYEAVNNVNSYGVDDKTLYIYGDASDAFAVIDMVNLATVQNKSFTITTNQVTAYSSTGPRPFAGGGLVGYAGGGIVAELAEAGPEMLHFANGGMMPVYDRGVYSVPPQTYVSPANTNIGGSTPTISFDFSGATFGEGSAAQIERVFSTKIVPSMVEAIAETKRGMGA